MPINPSEVRALRDRLKEEQQRRLLRPMPTAEEQQRLEELKQQAARQQQQQARPAPEPTYIQSVASKALVGGRKKNLNWIYGK